VLCLGRAWNLNAWGLFERSLVGSILGVGSNDWAHFTGKHLYFPNVLFVCQICTQIRWNYVKFEAKNGHFSVDIIPGFFKVTEDKVLLPLVGTSGYYWWPRIEYSNLVWTFHRYIYLLGIFSVFFTRGEHYGPGHFITWYSYWLKKWKIIETSTCSFCSQSEEDIHHPFWGCQETQKFWKDVERWHTPTIGYLNEKLFVYVKNDSLFCTVLFLAKRIIYWCSQKRN
jgi:hypothetical protein